jgi:Rrf2 family protein
MRVTTWTEYSLIIAIHLAKRGRTGGGPVAARELAESERLPPDYVEQILLRLRRANLVESVRGAKGGYFLARDPLEITVRDVMSASERQTFEVNCSSHPVDAERCAPDSGCSIRPIWHSLQQRVDEFLSSITLADLLKEQPKQVATPELVTLTT